MSFGLYFITDPDMNLSPLRELQEIPTQARIEADYLNLFSGGPIYYEVIDGNFPPNMTLIRETGFITGSVPEMDDWVDEFVDAIPEYTHENYATAGSAALFDQGTTSHYPTQYRSTFTVRAYNSANPDNMYVDGVFYFRLLNNWSSDRDRFIKNYDTQHFIDGNPVDNLTYLEEMKSLGYFD